MRSVISGSVVVLIWTLNQPSLQAQETIFLVRHAERAGGEGPNVPLTPFGKAQARLLADYLEDAGITAIYYSRLDPAIDPDHKGNLILRTKLTAAPLLERLNAKAKGSIAEYDLFYDPGKLANWRDHPEVMLPFAQTAVDTVGRNQKERPAKAILIVGHENTVPALIRQLASSRPWPLDPETSLRQTHEFMSPLEFGLLYQVKPNAATPRSFLRITRYATSSSKAVPGSVIYPIEPNGMK